jgi:hypothetical protein
MRQAGGNRDPAGTNPLGPLGTTHGSRVSDGFILVQVAFRWLALSSYA